MSKDSLEYLRSLPPFQDLPEESFDVVKDHLQYIELPSGHLIFDAGEPGDCLYNIKEGKVQVYITAPETSDKVILTILGEGDYFGEMALISGEPRSAAVETLEKTSLIRLDKAGFDHLVQNNPAVSLFFSDMLSQRLKNANLQRVQSEDFYHSVITPSGSLSDISFFEVLRWGEKNSLSGKIKLEQNSSRAEIDFVKGIVQTVHMGDLKEDEALDALMKWQDGKFVIEPTVYSMEEELSANPVDAETQKTIPAVIKILYRHVFERFVALIGSQTLMEITTENQKRLLPYFPTIEAVKITLSPKVQIDFKKETEWDDKRTLTMAVFLQSVLKSLLPTLIGGSFFDIEEIAGEHKETLRDISFFIYMSHANEFAV